ncbi:hypothetical protein ACJJIQ_07265 [Microbulbifer sp. ANSA003]|uniref:hypothetical protein n=1 Tax=Microbulbifer sp. ANSA003 TaxID=3243360 RepID=UPI00404242AE
MVVKNLKKVIAVLLTALYCGQPSSGMAYRDRAFIVESRNVNETPEYLMEIGLSNSVLPRPTDWWSGENTCNYHGVNAGRCAPEGISQWILTMNDTNRANESISSVAVHGNSKIKNYRLFELHSKYKGEDVRCLKKFKYMCPAYVIYYTDAQREGTKLSVMDGKIYDSTGELFDTRRAQQAEDYNGRAAIYVMDKNGNIYSSYFYPKPVFAHSTFLAGDSVAAAGEIVAEGGKIVFVNTCSGHYRPTPVAIDQLRAQLLLLGYTDISFSTSTECRWR